MDGWKAEMGRVREQKRRRKKIKAEKVRRKKIQVREKVGKPRNTVFFFQCFVAPGGRKEGSLKRQVLSLLATWEMKSYTLLWREALFGDKMYKRPQLRSTFRSWDVEKVDGIVARSTFPSQNVQNTPFPDHCWKLAGARDCAPCHK